MKGMCEELLSAAVALLPAFGYEANAHGVDLIAHRVLRHSRPSRRNAAAPRD